MEEIWKEIPNFEGLYEASNLGRIRSFKTKKIKKQRYTVKKYLQVNLYKKEEKTYRVHRLIAETFIKNFNNFPEINHKDGNKQNNCVDNLEWITTYDNIQHAIKNGLYNNKKNKRNKRNNKKERKIIQYNLDGKLLKEWNNISEIMKELNIKNNSHIYECCKGKRKKCYNSIWKYK